MKTNIQSSTWKKNVQEGMNCPYSFPGRNLQAENNLQYFIVFCDQILHATIGLSPHNYFHKYFTVFMLISRQNLLLISYLETNIFCLIYHHLYIFFSIKNAVSSCVRFCIQLRFQNYILQMLQLKTTGSYDSSV